MFRCPECVRPRQRGAVGERAALCPLAHGMRGSGGAQVHERSRGAERRVPPARSRRELMCGSCGAWVRAVHGAVVAGLPECPPPASVQHAGVAALSLTVERWRDGVERSIPRSPSTVPSSSALRRVPPAALNFRSTVCGRRTWGQCDREVVLCIRGAFRACLCRKHLKDILSSSRNVSSNNVPTSFLWGLDCDASRTSELLGVSLLKKEKVDDENTVEDAQGASSCSHKRQKMKERDFVIVRRPRLLRDSGASWDTLPDELLLAIFAYLPLSDLIRVSVVCKRWHRLSFDESLWQTLDLAGKILLPGVVGQLLPAGVTVFRCPRSSIGSPLFKTSKPLKLQCMDLSNCTMSVASLQSILSLCEKLQNLSLEGLVLSDDIIEYIAQNPSLVRLNLSGCSGFAVEPLKLMLSSCSMLDELNLSWCNFTDAHVKAAVNHITSKVTQLNLSGYRQNLQIQDVQTLVERCPLLVHLDLSDSVMLNPECFKYFHKLSYLQHLCLSRCYQISPADLAELGGIPTLKTLQVFGIVTDGSLDVLKESLPDVEINCSYFTSIARPTVGRKRSHEIWGIKCKLALRNFSGL
ncbi:S-phase kinase-associated protein 2 [Pezoporus wallicus]|uniref:S-phase kinase-associated protein 2 n=1 Tax=Pezoporus wallicus TaxID=35540 RepID=UPI00254A7156|nr:S-phase kinase-associated protein 2 [Pezoporus wallicus]